MMGIINNKKRQVKHEKVKRKKDKDRQRDMDIKRQIKRKNEERMKRFIEAKTNQIYRLGIKN